MCLYWVHLTRVYNVYVRVHLTRVCNVYVLGTFNQCLQCVCTEYI